MTKRYYAPYTEWEDYKAGMWRKATPTEEREMLPIAIEFTGNAQLYGEWMLKVIDIWPISCRHSLTNNNAGRRSWIGHAAVQLAHNIPEYITRQAWGMLTTQQQNEANAVADIAISKWEENNNLKGIKYDKELFGA